MKKRHPLAVLLLPLPTLGIYCLYWVYQTREEIVTKLQDPKAIPPFWVLLWPLILLVVLIFMTLFMIAGGPIFSSSDGGGIEMIMLLLIGIIGMATTVILPLWWFWHYCKAAVRVTQKAGGMDFAQSYILYAAITWICNIMPIWMLIQQLDYNKVADQEAQSTPGAPHRTAYPPILP
jgi:hypothetical protein